HPFHRSQQTQPHRDCLTECQAQSQGEALPGTRGGCSAGEPRRLLGVGELKVRCGCGRSYSGRVHQQWSKLELQQRCEIPSRGELLGHYGVVIKVEHKPFQRNVDKQQATARSSIKL
ncbi:unnamed protein product, partial [Urochloa humidicola]